MLLANGINGAIALYGLAILIPLTLLVVTIESYVFRRLLAVPMRNSWWLIFGANVVSTVVGYGVAPIQLELADAMGFDRVDLYSRMFYPIAFVLILLYWVKSVVIEGLVVGRRETAKNLNVCRSRLWRSVIVANVFSYLAVAPVFCFLITPRLGDLTFVDAAAKVSECEDWVYFTSQHDRICRIRANGSDCQELAPFEVDVFLLSEDKKAAVYRDFQATLWFASLNGGSPVKLCEVLWGLRMSEVALSADKQWVAIDGFDEVTIYDTQGRKIGNVDSGGTCALPGWSLAWDLNEKNVVHVIEKSTIRSYRVTSETLQACVLETPVLTTNIRPVNWYGYPAGRPWPEERLALKHSFGRAAYLEVLHKGETQLTYQNSWLPLALIGHGPRYVEYLSQPGLFAAETGNTIVVFDAFTKKAAALARGHDFAIENPRVPTLDDMESLNPPPR